MNAHMSITEPVTVSLFEIQPEHEHADSYSGIRDGWSSYRDYARHVPHVFDEMDPLTPAQLAYWQEQNR